MLWACAQVVSSLLAGAAVGSLAGSGLADQFGRRTTLLIDAVPMFLGAVLCATATSLNTLITGRLIAGIGIGLSSALVPLYISEVRTADDGGVWIALAPAGYTPSVTRAWS